MQLLLLKQYKIAAKSLKTTIFAKYFLHSFIYVSTKKLLNRDTNKVLKIYSIIVYTNGNDTINELGFWFL